MARWFVLDLTVHDVGYTVARDLCQAGLFSVLHGSRRARIISSAEFGPDGTPLCPLGGFTQACIRSPQAIVSDLNANIWIANFCGGSVTQYTSGNPDDAWVFDPDTGTLVDPNDCPRLGSRPNVAATRLSETLLPRSGRAKRPCRGGHVLVQFEQAVEPR
jgi:hypothetical protein